MNVVMIIPADENPYIIWDFKIARSDWQTGKIFMEKPKQWIGLVYMYVYKQYISFSII